MVAVAESFGRWLTITASPSAFHARGVELPQLRISNSGRFALLGEDMDDDETQSVGAVSHVGSNDDTARKGEADDEAESTFSDDRYSEAGEVEGPDAEDDCPTVEDIAPSRVLREALGSFDDVDISGVMRSRAVVMKNPHHFLRGAFRSVLRFALQEANAATAAQNERRQRSAWKSVPDGSTDVVVSQSKRRVDPKEPTPREVCTVHSGRVGSPLVGQSGGS